MSCATAAAASAPSASGWNASTAWASTASYTARSPAGRASWRAKPSPPPSSLSSTTPPSPTTPTGLSQKLCGWLREEKQLDLSYRTLVRYLHEHGYTRRIPRRMPEPPDRDQWEERRETFCVELLALLEDHGCDVFFGDEAGFEGDPRPRQKWVKRGSRPTQGLLRRARPPECCRRGQSRKRPAGEPHRPALRHGSLPGVP